METLVNDIRYSIRALRKDASFTLVAVCTIALGIGATVAIFSVINAVLLRPLPYREPERLVRIWETNVKRGGELEMTSVSNLLDWQRANQSISEFAVWQRPTSLTLTSQTPALELKASVVSANYFSLLGVSAQLGRTFASEENSLRNLRAVVISDELWHRQFGANPNVSGSKIQLEGKDFQLIGVMPKDFKGTAGEADCWLPMNFQPNEIDRGQTYLQVIGRLKTDVTIQQAQSEMDHVAEELARLFPDSNRDRGIRLVSLVDQTVGNVRQALLIVMGAVGLVLLITCANVANLFLVRAASRQQETAVRIALGASIGRLVRRVYTEVFVVALVGGALGLLLAVCGLRVLRELARGLLPRLDEISIDGQTLIFVLGVWLITVVLSGLAPALRICRPQPGDALKGTSRTVNMAGRNHLQSSLVVTQVAMALMLLACAGLLVKSFARLVNVDPNFRGENLLVVRIGLGDEYEKDNRQVAYFQELTKRLRELPGVLNAGAATVLPMNEFGIDFDVPYHRAEHEEPSQALAPKAKFRAITPEYFKTIGMPLIKGRDIVDQDDSDSTRVVIVNQLLANRAWPEENPIGKRLRFFWADWQTYEVVGVVGNAKSYGLQDDSQPELFVSEGQIPYTVMNVVVRTGVGPEVVTPEVRRTILELDPYQPPHSIVEMSDLISESTKRERFAMTWLGVLAMLALMLAAVGIYSVISHATARRTREIGIRMALGAQRVDVLKLVLRSGLTLVLIGVAFGIAGALLTTRLIRSLLFEVSTSDVATFSIVSVLMIIIALAASYLPARRATRVDPLVALHSE